MESQSNHGDSPVGEKAKVAYTRETLESCPYCQSKRLSNWIPVATDKLHFLSVDAFSYDHCLSCDLYFLNPRPVEKDTSVFYPDDYGPHQTDNIVLDTRSIRWASPLVKTFFEITSYVFKMLDLFLSLFLREKLTGHLEAFYTPSSTNAVLLDYGCGSGAFLNKARELGWKTLGLDFSQNAVSQAKHNGHEVYLISQEAWNNIPDGSITCIRLNHVLEHLYQPKAVLEILFKKLAPSGKIHIAVPNPKSFLAQISRRNWRSLECPRHVLLYPPAMLIALAQAAEFQQTHLIGEFNARDAAGSLGYWLHEKGRVTEEEAVLLSKDKLLRRLMRLPMRLGSSFGFADRIHLFAQRA